MHSLIWWRFWQHHITFYKNFYNHSKLTLKFVFRVLLSFFLLCSASFPFTREGEWWDEFITKKYLNEVTGEFCHKGRCLRLRYFKVVNEMKYIKRQQLFLQRFSVDKMVLNKWCLFANTSIQQNQLTIFAFRFALIFWSKRHTRNVRAIMLNMPVLLLDFLLIKSFLRELTT